MIFKPNPINELFQGSLQYTFKCKSCSNQTKNTEAFNEIILSLPKSEKPLDINQLLMNYLKPEILNDYFCEKCKVKPDSCEKTTIISKYPPVLIFVLNIFNVLDAEQVNKINRIVEVPLQLKNLQYNLDSVVCHYGNSVDYGHYIR